MHYTDPLKAEWMAREFGVKMYATANNTPINGHVDDVYLCEIFVCDTTIYHIHPDSLHIFEPMEGDLALSPSGAPWLSTGRKAIAAIHGNEIIQRNGKAFFMPESCDNSNRQSKN